MTHLYCKYCAWPVCIQKNYYTKGQHEFACYAFGRCRMGRSFSCDETDVPSWAFKSNIPKEKARDWLNVVFPRGNQEMFEKHFGVYVEENV